MNYTVLGFALMAIPLLVIFAIVVRMVGWKHAILIFGGALLTTAMIAVGAYLVELGQTPK